MTGRVRPRVLVLVLDMYVEKRLLPNFNLGMDDFSADFSEASVVTTVPTGPKIDPLSFDNDVVTDMELSQAMDIIDSEPTRFAQPLNVCDLNKLIMDTESAHMRRNTN